MTRTKSLAQRLPTRVSFWLATAAAFSGFLLTAATAPTKAVMAAPAARSAMAVLSPAVFTTTWIPVNTLN
jgi:hypothetical protein